MKKKYNQFFLTFLLVVIPSVLLCQQWDKVYSYEINSNISTVKTVCTDKWGNAYIGGYTSGDIELADTTIHLISEDDASFLIKFNPSGATSWVILYETWFGSSFCGLATDNQGNLFYSVNPGSNTIRLNDTLYFPTDFVAKLDSSGHLLWAQPIPSMSGAELITDGSGNVYTAFRSRFTTNDIHTSDYFGHIQVDNWDGAYDLGVGKFSANGQAQWVNLLTGTNGPAEPGWLWDVSVELTNEGNILAGGLINENIMATILNANNGNIINQYKSESGITNATAARQDSEGNIVVGGMFKGEVNLGQTTFDSGYDHNLFVVSYDKDGNENWARQVYFHFIYGYESIAKDLGMDRYGNIFLSGKLRSYPIVEYDTLDLWCGLSQAFIIKYDKDGNYYWTEQMGSIHESIVASMQVNEFSDIVVAGEHRGESQFGNIVLPPAGHSHFVGFLNGSQNQILGTVFQDLNLNGEQEPGEDAIEGMYVVKTPGYDYAYSNENGKVAFEGNQGHNQIRIFPQKKYHIYTPPFRSFNFAGTTGFDTTGYLGYTRLDNITDVFVSVIPPPNLRPGFVTNLVLNYGSTGTDTVSGTVSLRMDTLFTMQEFSIPPDYISSDYVTWNYADLIQYDEQTINIKARLSPACPIDTVLYAEAFISPVLQDTIPYDNYQLVNLHVTGSFDPNNKTVYPNEDITPGFISDANPLKYLIRFQNTGTDTAFTVSIIDTISGLVDLESIQVIATSHEYELRLIGERVIEFNFPHILLPDSNANNIASNGYIQYQVTPLQTLVVGDSIENTAYIYFDYNEAIQTNTTKTKVVVPSDIDDKILNEAINITVFPNPAREYVTLKAEWDKPEEVAIDLYTIYGTKVDSYQSQSKIQQIQTTFSLIDKPHGIYVLVCKVGEITFLRKIVLQ